MLALMINNNENEMSHIVIIYVNMCAYSFSFRSIFLFFILFYSVVVFIYLLYDITYHRSSFWRLAQ